MLTMNKILALDFHSQVAALLFALLEDEMNEMKRPSMHKSCCTERQCKCNAREFTAPTPRHDFTREPDGVQINVDRPRREKFASRSQWANAMSNYRMLIDQAKKCNWESRIPSNIPPHVHENRRDWYEDNEKVSPRQMVDCFLNKHNATPWGW